MEPNTDSNLPSSRSNQPDQSISLQLLKPKIFGYMSVDAMRELHHDLSQIKYLTSIPEGRLYFDLNHNIDKASKRTTNDNNEKISLLLKYILHQKHRLKPLFDEGLTFISYRRSLISVMCNIYTRSPVSIVATLFNNCIYLCSLESSLEVSMQKSCKDIDKFCAWGYKFEQYMLSDAPNVLPNIERPVLENEEFSLYYYSELGKHRLFYGAQIDGMLAMFGKLKDVPLTNDVNVNLNFLRRNQYIELKTNKEILNRFQEINFMRYKLLRCWCQCYLAGLKGLLVGYRNNYGIVQEVEWFDTARIVNYCRPRWDPQGTLNFLDHFLHFVKDSFNTLKTDGEDYVSKSLTLKFDIDERHQFTVATTDNEDHVILPNWYTEKYNN